MIFNKMHSMKVDLLYDQSRRQKALGMQDVAA